MQKLHRDLEHAHTGKADAENKLQEHSKSSGNHSTQIKALEDQVKALGELKAVHDETVQRLISDVDAARAEKYAALQKALDAADEAKWVLATSLKCTDDSRRNASDNAIEALKAGHEVTLAAALQDAEERHTHIIAAQVELAKQESMNRLDGLRQDLDKERISEQGKGEWTPEASSKREPTKANCLCRGDCQASSFTTYFAA